MRLLLRKGPRAETSQTWETVLQVAGVEGKATVNVIGTCDYPRIATEPQKVFAKRSKHRPASAKVAKQFITSTGLFEFGPLLAGLDPAGYK